MRKRLLIIYPLVFLIIAALPLVAAGCRSSATVQNEAVTEEPEEEQDADYVPPKEERWVPVKTFTGKGRGITGEFEITSEHFWRVIVSKQGADPSASFAAYIHLTGENPNDPVDHGKVTGRGSGPAEGNFAETGLFFIRMETSDGTPWMISVEQAEEKYAE